VTVFVSVGTPLKGAAAIVGSTGLHTCARLTDGSSVCWGRNEYGEFGIGSTTTYSPHALSTPF